MLSPDELWEQCPAVAYETDCTRDEFNKFIAKVRVDLMEEVIQKILGMPPCTKTDALRSLGDLCYQLTKQT